MKKTIAIFISAILAIGAFGYITTSAATYTGTRISFAENRNPDPIYKANKDKPKESFLSNDKVLNIVAKHQIKASTSKVKSIKTTTWGAHLTEDEPDNKLKNYIVDDNRMVSVVTTTFPDGLNTKAGFYANATLITVFDSETGDLLESTVTGDYKGITN